ncbi:MAG: trehalose-phosphatase [Microbacterium sp.]
MTLSTPDELDAALRRAAPAERLLVASDFDGTLAPLADDPMSVRMTPAGRAAVEELAALPDTTVALVSGRSLHDLEIIAEHSDDSPIVLAGSHGAEFRFPGAGAGAGPGPGAEALPGPGAVEPDVPDEDLALRDVLRAHAEALIAGIDGAWIEPKTFGFGVHTRRVGSASAAREANARVDALVRARAPHWRRRTGHSIVEYAFRHEGKDDAVARLRARLGATCVVFAGDDVTDEDALESLWPGDVGVHVGAGPTAAAVRVADIPAFAAFLAELAGRRATRAPAPARRAGI